MAHLTKKEWKGLWSVLWRVLIFGPIVGLFGLALLGLVIAAFAGLPLYAVLGFLAGDWLLSSAALIAWSVALRFHRPILRWALEGLEHAGL